MSQRVVWSDDAYAGFWRRAAAYIIDTFVFYAAAMLLFTALGATMTGLDPTAEPDPAEIQALFSRILPAYLGLIIGYFLYDVVMTSKLGWTLGKVAVGIEVRGADGRLISIPRAIGRVFARIVSALPLYLGFAWAGWDRRKQTFHDKIVSTYVLKRHRTAPAEPTAVGDGQTWSGGHDGWGIEPAPPVPTSEGPSPSPSQAPQEPDGAPAEQARGAERGRAEGAPGPGVDRPEGAPGVDRPESVRGPGVGPSEDVGGPDEELTGQGRKPDGGRAGAPPPEPGWGPPGAGAPQPGMGPPGAPPAQPEVPGAVWGADLESAQWPEQSAAGPSPAVEGRPPGTGPPRAASAEPGPSPAAEDDTPEAGPAAHPIPEAGPAGEGLTPEAGPAGERPTPEAGRSPAAEGATSARGDGDGAGRRPGARAAGDPNVVAIDRADVGGRVAQWLREVASQVDPRLDRVEAGWRSSEHADAARACAFGLLIGHLAATHPHTRDDLGRVAGAHPSFTTLPPDTRLETLQEIAADHQRATAWLGALIGVDDPDRIRALFD